MYTMNLAEKKSLKFFSTNGCLAKFCSILLPGCPLKIIIGISFLTDAVIDNNNDNLSFSYPEVLFITSLFPFFSNVVSKGASNYKGVSSTFIIESKLLSSLFKIFLFDIISFRNIVILFS